MSLQIKTFRLYSKFGI